MHAALCPSVELTQQLCLRVGAHDYQVLRRVLLVHEQGWAARGSG